MKITLKSKYLFPKIKINTNCKEEEKNGRTGPGSCSDEAGLSGEYLAYIKTPEGAHKRAILLEKRRLKASLAKAAAEIFRKNDDLIDPLMEYTGEMYSIYNKVIAGVDSKEFNKMSDQDKAKIKVHINLLSDAIKSAKLPEPVVTYRGIRESTFKRLEALGATEVGSEFQINQFQSTTITYGETSAYVGKNSDGLNLRIEIKLPKDSPAAYIDEEFAATGSENEVLVAPGTKFRCTGIEKTNTTKMLLWEAIL